MPDDVVVLPAGATRVVVPYMCKLDCSEHPWERRVGMEFHDPEFELGPGEIVKTVRVGGRDVMLVRGDLESE